MNKASCTHPDSRRLFSVIEFEELPAEKIKKYRHFLYCQECGAISFYRRQTVDGKSACFGSRYHVSGCIELSKKYNARASEIDLLKIAAINNGSITLPLGGNRNKENGQSPYDGFDSETLLSKIECTYHCSPGDILSLLLHGDELNHSNSTITLLSGFSWKAKNLFVNIGDAQPSDKPKVFWGVVSHANKTQQWLNVSGRVNVGIPIGEHREMLLNRYSADNVFSFEKMGILVFGKCFSNKNNDGLIIKPWNDDGSNIYLV